MKLYVVTLTSYNSISDVIIKIFSDKSMLDKWMSLCDEMERELFGPSVDPSMPISKRYRVREALLDNLDFVTLYSDAAALGASVKPPTPQ